MKDLNTIKEIILPEGWILDKIENGKAYLKEDTSKPHIYWNWQHDGVGVKQGKHDFVIKRTNNKVRASFCAANEISNLYGGELPSIEEMELIFKNIEKINFYNRLYTDPYSSSDIVDTYKKYWTNEKHKGSTAYVMTHYQNKKYYTSDNNLEYFITIKKLN